jgi:hypothetical protein
MRNIQRTFYLTLATCICFSGCGVNKNVIYHPINGEGQFEYNMVEETIWKTESDGSHLPSADNKDFYTRSFSDNLRNIYPQNNQAPRALLLMTNKFEFLHMTKRAKNLALCQGFMDLPFAQEVIKKDKGPNLDDQVITYMLVKDAKLPIPNTPATCSTFIDKVYDYSASQTEIKRVLGDNPKGKAPYIVLYESQTSPYSSMVLSLGDLSAESIKVISKKWPILIKNVYMYGAAIDPTIGISMSIDNDPELLESEKQALRNKISILVSSVSCVGAVAGTTVTYASIIGTATCKSAIEKTAAVLGYSSPV